MKCVVVLVIISFVYILFVHNGHTFKGIKMCQRECELTKGCMSIYYDPVYLECRLLFDKKKSGAATAPAVTRLVVKTSVTEDVLKVCFAKDRVVISGVGKSVCVPTEDTSQYSPSGRILFAKATYYTLISQLKFGKKIPIVNTHLLKKPMRVRSMQFSRSLQTLFIAQLTPNNIFSIYIGKMKKSVIRNKLYKILRVDGNNGLLFAASATYIHKMTIQGRLLRRVHRLPVGTSVRALAIDTQHALLYAVLCNSYNGNYAAISFRYSGEDIHVLFEHAQPHIFFAGFDQMSRSLVYAQKQRLVRFDPSTKKQKHSVLTTVDDIRGMTIYKGTLYFVDGNSLIEFGYRNKNKKTLLDLPGSDWYHLCIID